jgi:hypothetical protein
MLALNVGLGSEGHLPRLLVMNVKLVAKSQLLAPVS